MVKTIAAVEVMTRIIKEEEKFQRECVKITKHHANDELLDPRGSNGKFLNVISSKYDHTNKPLKLYLNSFFEYVIAGIS